MSEVGRLRRVPLRTVWKHEAADFSVWLEQNLEILNEVLDFNLINAEREKAAGAFSVDLVGEDEEGRTVVIENQLERSDHDHLGKLLTYLAALEAQAAIWIVAHPRQEHAQAIAWLNTATSIPFYLIQVEAVQIGDSPPAPLLTTIVAPSPEAQAVGATRRDLSERHKIRRRFWTLLLERARAQTQLHAQRSPSHDSWLSAGSGVTSLEWVYNLRKDQMQVSFYIDRQEPDLNLLLFDRLHNDKDKIEQLFGAPLRWQRLENRRVCRISYLLPDGGWSDQARWPTIADASIDAMQRLHQALHPYLPSLRQLIQRHSAQPSEAP